MYRRRRIVALIAALAALAIVLFVVISDIRFVAAVGGAVNERIHYDDAHAVSRSAVPSPDPSLSTGKTAGIPDCTSNDVTLSFASDDGDSSDAKSPSASASASESGSASGPASASGQADDSDVSGSIVVSSGQSATFTAVLTHTSKQNCLANAASDSEALVITSAATGDVVYDSSACDADPIYLLMRNSDEDRRDLTWATDEQTDECVTDPSLVLVKPGTYYAQLQLKDVSGVQSQKMTVYVKASSASSAASGSSAGSASASGSAGASASGSASASSGE